MQVATPYGDLFTVEQTIHPFTAEERVFNQKEANSTGNCVGGCNSRGSVQLSPSDVYVSHMEKSISNLNKQFGEILKSKDDRPGKINNTESFVNMDSSAEDQFSGNTRENFIVHDARFMNPTSPDIVNNATPKDFTYNSYADWRNPTFNQWTRYHDDDCNEENRLRIGSKPMKYYVNQYNSPQADPFMEYTIIGNQKSYNVRNDFERAMPTRLNPIYPVQVEPYPTTPFLGSTNMDRVYTDTSTQLRFGNDLRSKKSETAITEVDYNRWSPGVDPQTVQNAGQFGAIACGGKLQHAINMDDGYYDYDAQNNVILGNSAVPYFGLSSRNLLYNISELSGC